MYHFEKMIGAYGINGIPQADLAKGIAGFHKIFDYVEEHDKGIFWDAMKKVNILMKYMLCVKLMICIILKPME